MEKTQEQFSATPYIHVGWPINVPDKIATPYIHVGWAESTKPNNRRMLGFADSAPAYNIATNTVAGS